MSTIGRMLRHRIAIERSVETGTDDYNQPVLAWDAIATDVPALVQPMDLREREQVNQAGAVVSDHKVFLFAQDIRSSDRVRFDPDDGRRFEVTEVPDAMGDEAHLVVRAKFVDPGVAPEEGS